MSQILKERRQCFCPECRALSNVTSCTTAKTMSPKGGHLKCKPKAKGGMMFCFDTLIHINLEDAEDRGRE